jgi:hypothetical protein
MFFRSLARAGTLFSAAALFAIVTTTANAAAPVFTGNPIQANFIGTLLRVNLKQQNVIVGGPPVNITVGAIQPSTVGIIGFVVPPANNTLCLQIEDEGYDPVDGGPVTVQLTATNGMGQQSTQIVPVQLVAGPTVNIGNAVEVQA